MQRRKAGDFDSSRLRDLSEAGVTFLREIGMRALEPSDGPVISRRGGWTSLLAHGLSVGRGEYDEKNRFLVPNVGRVMPYICRNGHGIPFMHFRLGVIGHGVKDTPLKYSQNLHAIGMIMTRVALPWVARGAGYPE